MAVIGEGLLTTLDIAKQRDPSGRIADIAEVLSQTNELVQDMPMVESNAPTTNTVTVRTSLPTVAFTMINQGVARSKGSSKQRKDSIGILAALSDVDKRLRLTSGGNFDKVRWNEDQAFLEAMAQTAAFNVLYGDEDTDASAFTGLRPRFNSSTGEYGSQIVKAGSSDTDNTSIWIIDWHERYCFGIYPLGSTAGLSAEDRGIVPVTDDSGNPFEAYRTAYEWALGISVKDHRHVARICNIEVSAIATAGSGSYSGPDIVNYIIDALGKMQPPNGAKRCLYCNGTVETALNKLALAKANLALGFSEFAGRQVTTVRGIPIRRVDQISNAEALVT